MCGIVGLYLKKKSLYSKLGTYLSEMLINMSSRGPDSAGFAIYNNTKPDQNFKFSISFPLNLNLNKFQNDINNQFKDIKTKKISDHLVITTKTSPKKFISYLNKNYEEINIIGYGKSIEVFKQVGNPKKIVKNFDLTKFSGSHAIGHTRMATESAITLDGSHPYSTGEDECLVHNGSLSNHNNLRRELSKKGNIFNSENDTEVAAGYVSHSLSNKKSLKDTLTSGLKDLDGLKNFLHHSIDEP